MCESMQLKEQKNQLDLTRSSLPYAYARQMASFPILNGAGAIPFKSDKIRPSFFSKQIVDPRNSPLAYVDILTGCHLITELKQASPAIRGRGQIMREGGPDFCSREGGSKK